MKIFSTSLLLTWKVPLLAMTGFFVFCQVIGVMCGIPNLAMAEKDTILSEEGVACSMDGTIMCPPSATSSPERQMKNGLTLGIEHTPIFLHAASALITSSAPTIRSRSSVSSLAPTSIGASSVLRI